MRVGLTYDLRQDYLDEGYSLEETAEFDKQSTIDGIDNALKALGYETDRIGNIKSLVKRLATGDRWDIVFNIAEGMYGIAREAQVPALLDAYNIPYTFSDPVVLTNTLHKGITKSIVREHGVATADFFVVESKEDIDKVNLSYPLFAKPVAEGTGKGITEASKVKSKEELVKVCTELLKTFNQPVLIETFLSGREFTVGVVGTGDEAVAIGSLEIILNDKAEQDVYSYHNKEYYEDLVDYTLAEGEVDKQCKELAVKAWKALKCRDGGRVDVRFDSNGVVNFIEVNPLAGLNPETSDLPIMCKKLDLPYKDLIGKIMNSAVKRVK